MELCQESELSGEDRGKCVHYWFNEREEGFSEGGMMPSRRSTLRQLKMELLHDAMSEVMRPLYGSSSTGFELDGSRK